MINYNTKKWRTLLHDFQEIVTGHLRKQVIFKTVVFIALYNTVITVINLDFLPDAFNFSPTFFSMVGVILSLMLVFRLNSAYDRWWEGRKQWGQLVNDCRTLASHFNSLVPKEDAGTRRFIAAQIGNFCHSLKHYLRDDKEYKDLDPLKDGYYKKVTSAYHVPHKITSILFEKMEQMFQEKRIIAEDKIILKPQIQSFIDILGACERIKNTPIPYSHSSFVKTFILIYVLVLPFGLIHTFQYFTIPVAVMVSYILVGVEIISEEVENPFGDEDNDLPLHHLSTVIRKNVYDILEVDHNYVVRTDYEEMETVM